MFRVPFYAVEDLLFALVGAGLAGLGHGALNAEDDREKGERAGEKVG